MPRTKEFDPEMALEVAVRVFWRLGYERTSLDILMREMGISKQSLYDTFGDKRSIFFRAMQRYRRSTNDSLREVFAREKSVRDGFLKVFDSLILETKEEHQRGCLLMSANLSRDINDAELTRFLRSNQREVERIFTDALTKARGNGEIALEKNPAEM